MKVRKDQILGTAQAVAPFVMTGAGLCFAVIPSMFLVRALGGLAVAAGVLWLLAEAYRQGKADAYDEATKQRK